MPKNDKLALFLLRLGLGVFLLIWGIDKFIDTEGTIGIFKFFYGQEISVNVAYVFGTLEIILALLFLAGLWKTYTYGLGTLVHAFSTASSIRLMIPGHEMYDHLFVAALPVLAGFVALWLLRDEDTLWTFPAKLQP